MDGGKDGSPLGGPIGLPCEGTCGHRILAALIRVPGSENPTMMGCGCGKGGMNPAMGGMCGMGPGMCGGMGMPMGGGMMGKGGMPGMPGNMPGSMPGAMGAGMGMGNMMPNMMGNMGGTMGNGMMGMGGMNPMMVAASNVHPLKRARARKCHAALSPTKAMMGMMMGMQAAMGGEATADATPTIKSEDKHASRKPSARNCPAAIVAMSRCSACLSVDIRYRR